MQAAGLRGHRVRFERRANLSDAYGNVVGVWQTLATVWAGVDTRQKGRGETLEAGRLESVVSWRVSVLKSSEVSSLTHEDRGVFVVGPHIGRIFNIRAVEVSPDSRELWLEVVAGVAT